MRPNEFQSLFEAVWGGDEAAASALGDFLVEYVLDMARGSTMFFATAEHVVQGVQIIVIFECHVSNDGEGNRKIVTELRDQQGLWTSTYRTDNPGGDCFATMLATEIIRTGAWIRNNLIDSLRRDGDD